MGAYKKDESDRKYQPLGNYASSTSETFTGTVRAPSIITGTGNNLSYFFQRDGVWVWTVQQNGIWKGEIKHPSRGGVFALQGDSYTKGESDNKYQLKGNYVNRGESYTKSESDSRYQPRGNYQPAGNYAVRGECYTKEESDSRYLRTKVIGWKLLYNGGGLSSDGVNINEDIRGKIVWVLANDDWNSFCLPPVDNIPMWCGNTDNNWCTFKTTNGGRKIHRAYGKGNTSIRKVYVAS